MDDISIPITYKANRSKFTCIRNSFEAKLDIPGMTRVIIIEGTIYIPIIMALKPICVDSSYNDQFKSTLDLSKFVIELNGYIRKNMNKGDSKWFVREIKLQRVVFPPFEELEYIVIPFMMVFEHTDEKLYDNVIAGIQVSSIKDECGNEFFCSTRGIRICLKASWEKMPTNPCIPCIDKN